MIVVLVSALALIAAMAAPRFIPADVGGWIGQLDAVERALRRFGPLVGAVISIAVMWYVWDGLVPIATVHDENSYLLQAEIFARGRWTVPSPPIPDFFEQPHVLVVPAVASKYPPGHALLLSLGALVKFPPLVPLLLTGLTAGMLVALATRLTNGWIGLLTWILWITAPIVLRFQPSYFSEVTTGALILGAWWCLLEWRQTRRAQWLWATALLVGWGAITRPLTLLAFATPIGVVVLRDVVRLKLWRDFGVALAVGIAVLSLLPVWNAKTTGNWRLSPIELYRRDYLPFDKIGFTPDTSAPRRSVSPVLKSTYDYFLVARREQPLAAIPGILADRVVQLSVSFFQGARLPLVLFAIAGLFFMTGPLRFAIASCALVFLAHLPYAHWAPWTLYYLETAPVVALFTAIGVWRAVERVVVQQSGQQFAFVLVATVLIAFGIPSAERWRRDHRTRSALDRTFATHLQKLPRHSIVFVKYSPRVVQHLSAVFNYPDLTAVPVWVVHDLGARNDELRKLAPDRASFDFEEDQLVSRRRP